MWYRGAGKLTRADMYTIKAVGQDEFEDVKVPDAPAQSAQSGTADAARK